MDEDDTNVSDDDDPDEIKRKIKSRKLKTKINKLRKTNGDCC